MCPPQMAAEQAEIVPDGPAFYGVIKSYNERRGFGFVACEETARRFGRDVYLSKEEAVILAQERIVGLPPAPGSEDGGLPIREGDFVQFQVQRSTEGYPQAVRARRIRRLRGTVTRPAGPGDSEGTIVVKGDGASTEAEAAPDENLRPFLGAEVRVRQADCGQLRLATDDEVAFCCAAAADSSSGPQVLEAQLVELLWTPRTGSLLLGCFTLDLPRTVDPAEATATGEDGAAAPVLRLDGHALADRVVLSGLPKDLAEPELMRLFSKLGAKEAIVTHPDDASGASAAVSPSFNGFASITFSGPVDIARMLVRAAHTINEQGSTQLARLGPCRRGVGQPPIAALPALPMPVVTAVDNGALLVSWSQVSLAAGYSVELRPVGEDAQWSSVDVAAGSLEDPQSAPLLPSGLLGPQCAACKVNSLRTDVPYEARVKYFTLCGCCSQASSSSVPVAIVPATLDKEQALPGSLAAAALAVTEEPMTPTPPVPVEPVPPLVPPTAPPAAPPSVPLPLDAGLGAPFAAAPQTVGAAPLAPPAPPAAPTLPAPPAPPAMLPPATAPFVDGGQLQRLPDYPLPQGFDAAPVGLPSPLLPPPGVAPGAPHGLNPGWRCPHGSLIPPPAAPELIPFEEAGRSSLVQWPTVVHATAYTVELFDEATGALERFQRTVPENLTEAIVELRVGNLQPSSYGACVRCVAPCGCESAPSAWSFLPPAWATSRPPLGLGWPPPGVPQPGPVPLPQQHQPAYLQPPSALLSTSPGSLGGMPPPPPPSEPPAVLAGPATPTAPAVPAVSSALAAPAAPNGCGGSSGVQALVLD